MFFVFDRRFMKKFLISLLISSIGIAQTIPTPNMDLQLPIPTVTLGPDWAVDLNAAFDLVDSHDHTSGKGVLVPSAGLNINTDLSCHSNNLTNVRSTRYINNGSPISGPSDLGAVFESGGDLYYNNSIGQHVQITQGAGLSLTSAGGFNGDYVGSTASASYSSLSGTFTFTQGPNTAAIMDSGPLVVRTTQVSSNGVTITPPNSLASPYQITLLAALPSTTNLLAISSSGQLTATIPSQIFYFFTSSVVNTDSTVTNSSFTTFGNSPAFTFTPSVTGTYKVYTSVPLGIATSGAGTGTGRIIKTSGTGTLLAESQGGFDTNTTQNTYNSTYLQSTYTLTAATPYVFDIQGKVATGASQVSILAGTIGQFYMFAEYVGP